MSVVACCFTALAHLCGSYVKTRRGMISPNLGFMGQLMQFERRQFPELTESTLEMPDAAPSTAATPSTEPAARAPRKFTLPTTPLWPENQ